MQMRSLESFSVTQNDTKIFMPSWHADSKQNMAYAVHQNEVIERPNNQGLFIKDARYLGVGLSQKMTLTAYRDGEVTK